MVTVNFATEAVFEIDRTGRCWAMAGFGDPLWAELLETFSSVRIIARAKRTDAPTLTVPVVDPRVSLFPLPYYRGPSPFLRMLPATAARLWTAAALNGAFLLRLPGPVGTLLSEALRHKRRRYGVQMVGDPNDVLGGGGLGIVARGLRRPVVAVTRRAVRGAATVGYVTGQTLQRRYPCAPLADSFAVSDVMLTDAWFGSERRAPTNDPARLFLCGSLAQRYKGVDLMLEAMALMRSRGLLVAGVIAGDGVHRADLEEQAQRLGLGESVTFLGAIPSEGIREELDRADLFVMPSRTEGMPRALIEAMARGLPAVGSDVGGITELLDEAERFPRGDVEGFAAAVTRLLTKPSAYAAQSARNLSVAKDFSAIDLAPRRQAFYRAVRDSGEYGT